jgi:hypothetical protein
MELILLIQDGLGWTTHLQAVQIDQVTEAEHLAFVVFTFLFVTLLLVFVDFFAFSGFKGTRLLLLLAQSGNLLIKFSLSINKLQ